jgi:thiosulfate/3-mercaptopyruvate sulfurtransferase
MKQLLSPDDLALLLNEREIDLAILEAHGNGSLYCDNAHVPGATAVNLNEFEVDMDAVPRRFWRLVDDQTLAANIERLGISKDTTVIIYADRMLPAARLAFALLYAGVEDVRVLDGGLAAWRASGQPTARFLSPPRAARPFGARIPVHPEYIVTTDELRARMATPDHQIGDVRSLDEWEGRATGYSYVSERGRIAGARWARGGPSSHRLEDYGDEFGRWRDFREVEAMWIREGIERGRPTTFYCGTGWRSAVAFLFALWMGWQNVSLYDGGWFLWSEGPDARRNPIARPSSMPRSLQRAG